jgi:hypothetical protein
MTARPSHRWLLWAYPRAYREIRGQEVLATLDELAPEGTRLGAGQALNCWLHGARLRLTSTPPVVAALVLFVAALVACAGVDLAQPPAYRSSALVLVGSASSSRTVVAAQMRDPLVRHIADSLSGSRLDACTAGPKPGAPAALLTIECTAGSSRLAASGANALVAAYNRVLVLANMRHDRGLIAYASRWIQLATTKLRSVPPSTRPALERGIEHARASRASVRRTLALTAIYGVDLGKLRHVGLTVIAYAIPGVELPRLSTVHLLIAGSVGMAVALMVGAWLRRRPSASWAG